MTLSERQMVFTANIAKLILEIFGNGDSCTFGEVWRTPEQAALNAKKGVGIKNSLHLERLAVDLNLFKNGKLSSNIEDYRPYGELWKALNEDNNWGGDFTTIKDPYHFSMSDGMRKTK